MEYLFRGISKADKKWIYGDVVHVDGDTFVFDYSEEGDLSSYDRMEVIPETVGQLRHKNSYGSYFDGDIYYHAGHGDEIVSGLCELHEALLHGNDEDICDIKGNIHDNPELLNS
jgi:hypothetical protein